MGDPRLNGVHLGVSRHDQYDAAVDEMLDNRRPATAEADPLARSPACPRPRFRRDSPPPGGTYTLVSFPDGRRHPLRVGINAVGRFPENDLVLEPICVSRRHCVIVVHASGGCEVYDTASRNGTFVNRRRVGRADLLPRDVLTLAGQRFVLAWSGPSGEMFPPTDGLETVAINGLSPTCPIAVGDPTTIDSGT